MSDTFTWFIICLLGRWYETRDKRSKIFWGMSCVRADVNLSTGHVCSQLAKLKWGLLLLLLLCWSGWTVGIYPGNQERDRLQVVWGERASKMSCCFFLNEEADRWSSHSGGDRCAAYNHRDSVVGTLRLYVTWTAASAHLDFLQRLLFVCGVGRRSGERERILMRSLVHTSNQKHQLW